MECVGCDGKYRMTVLIPRVRLGMAEFGRDRHGPCLRASTVEGIHICRSDSEYTISGKGMLILTTSSGLANLKDQSSNTIYPD